MKIFSGNAHRDLAKRIASASGVPLSDADVVQFPDGEIFVKIKENIRGADVFIVQPVCYPPNKNLMELLIMIDAAKRASARRITAVIPYYGYARQDRKDQPRVPISSKLVANLLVASGVDRILTMDLHSQQIQGFFDIPVDHLYALPVMVNYLLKKDLKDLIVVSPDSGGLKMAYAYSRPLESGIALVGKQRKSATEVESNYLVGDVEGCDTLLVDDITSTAGTLDAAAMLLKESGARSIKAAVSHAILSDDGVQKLKNSVIEELITTDSVPRFGVDISDGSVTVLSVAKLLSSAIERIHNNKSVSSLFDI